jgi:hypothetical protein
MPRDGALILSEVRVPVLTVVMRQYGWDAKLTDLLPALTVDCPKRCSVSIYDRLGAS